MLFRAVLAAAALSYLVCVLWLSGLQKEDLDVNLLKKLQRHNVNIDDIMNNETMRHECVVNKPESTTRTKIPVLKMKITATLSTTLDQAKSVNATDKYLDTIVNLMSTAQSNNSTEERKIDKTRRSPKTRTTQTRLLKSKYVKSNTPFENDSKRDIEFDSKRDIEVDSKRDIGVESKEDDLKLQQNIINFWEKMSKTETPSNVDEVLSTLPVISTKDIFRQRLLSRRVPKLITPRPYFTTSTPLQPSALERLIAKFLSKAMGQVPSTTTTTTDSNVPNNLEEALLPFYKDLVRRYNGRQLTEDDVSSQVKANRLNENPRRNLVNARETTEEPQEPERTNIPNTAIGNYENIFLKNGRIYNGFKRNRPNVLPKVPFTRDPSILTKQQEILSNVESIINHDFHRRYMRRNTELKKEHTQNIPNNTLHEIAESVKAIVLKDIGHLITGTTPSSIHLKLTSSPPLLPSVKTTKLPQDPVIITTPKQQDKTDANHVMEKILEIYQRIKTISDHTDLLQDVKYNKLVVNQDHSGASNQYLPAHLSNTNVIHRTSNVQNVVMSPTSFQDLTQQEIKKLPSIIQTNSGEIAPLVLPMPNPLKIINQIVVLTTEAAVKKADVNEKPNSRFETFMDDLSKYKVHALAHQKNDHNYIVPNHERYSHFAYSDINYPRKDHVNMPSKHDFLSGELYDQAHRYREFNRGVANGKPRNHNVMEREHINYSEHVLGHSDFETMPRYRHGEKFHEQLEKGVERWGDKRNDFVANQRDERHGRHVAPRHQQPLNNRKRPYDDTHFRNFLKTQEKVNDMLEKILGKKDKFDDYSVETP